MLFQKGPLSYSAGLDFYIRLQTRLPDAGQKVVLSANCRLRPVAGSESSTGNYTEQ